jgi:predicted alpha/beta superfamily hydrolase
LKILRREVSNTLARTDIWTVKPDSYDQKYLIFVTRPLSANGVLHGTILTDGNQVAGTAMQLASYLEMGDLIQGNVIISIGYPLDNALPAIVARNQDLTPTAWPAWDASYSKILQLPCPPSGRCDAFRSFIIDELKPELVAEFGIHPDEWMLGGHSLGGLFAIHTLLTGRASFKRYFAVGSSFWWHKPLMLNLAEHFSGSTQVREISVYLAAGELESGANTQKEWKKYMRSPDWQEYIRIMGGYPDIVKDTQDMAAILARCPGYRVKAETLANETHGTALFAAMSQGFRWLYQG